MEISRIPFISNSYIYFHITFSHFLLFIFTNLSKFSSFFITFIIKFLSFEQHKTILDRNGVWGILFLSYTHTRIHKPNRLRLNNEWKVEAADRMGEYEWKSVAKSFIIFIIAHQSNERWSHFVCGSWRTPSTRSQNFCMFEYYIDQQLRLCIVVHEVGWVLLNLSSKS